MGIDLLFLPTYSPALNPNERVWNLMKKHAIIDRYFQLLSDPQVALSGEFNRHFRPNEEMTKLRAII